MTDPKAPHPSRNSRTRALTGLPLTAEDIEHLHKGYVGLLKLMERTRATGPGAEPPHVFRADE